MYTAPTARSPTVMLVFKPGPGFVGLWKGMLPVAASPDLVDLSSVAHEVGASKLILMLWD